MPQEKWPIRKPGPSERATGSRGKATRCESKALSDSKWLKTSLAALERLTLKLNRNSLKLLLVPEMLRLNAHDRMKPPLLTRKAASRSPNAL